MYHSFPDMWTGSEMRTGFWIIDLVIYVVGAIALYRIAHKADIRNSWVAFIPFVQFIIVLHCIDRSGWYILLLLVPILNAVLGIIWFVKFYLTFEVNVGLIVLSIIIPVVNLVMLLVVAYSDQFTYKGSTRFTVEA